MIKANDPDIYDVKLGKFSARRHQLFTVVAKEPIRAEHKSVTHGGLYYSRDSMDKFTFRKQTVLPFERTVGVSKKEKIKQVEDILKKNKSRPRSHAN